MSTPNGGATLGPVPPRRFTRSSLSLGPHRPRFLTAPLENERS
jgi:hypothetical protein